MQVEIAAILVARRRLQQQGLKQRSGMNGGARAGEEGSAPAIAAASIDMNARLMPAKTLVPVNTNSVVAALTYRCITCYGTLMHSVCIAAVIANFAYRAVSHLFSRVFLVFPPSSPCFDDVVECLDFPLRLPRPLNLHMLLRRAEQVPLYFLIRMAAYFSHFLLGMGDEFKTEYSGRGQAKQSKVQDFWDGEADQENGGEVREEVRMWYSAAKAA
ncbi:unnamed protein product [Closterium sp. Naga37s-1]|nr:unnamed protein product [Closterium sp. Naga37s-1]